MSNLELLKLNPDPIVKYFLAPFISLSLKYPALIAKELPIFPENWKYSYVDSHSEMNYNFVLPIPDDAKVLTVAISSGTIELKDNKAIILVD